MARLRTQSDVLSLAGVVTEERTGVIDCICGCKGVRGTLEDGGLVSTDEPHPEPTPAEDAAPQMLLPTPSPTSSEAGEKNDAGEAVVVLAGGRLVGIVCLRGKSTVASSSPSKAEEPNTFGGDRGGVPADMELES